MELFGNPTAMIHRLLVWLPLAIVSLCVHEYAHAATATALGDPTPRTHGRLTLDPRAHLDVFGTLMMLMGPMGWARPVPVDPRYLRGRLGELAVSLAGPASNVLLALVAAVCLKYLNLGDADRAVQTLFFLNIGLAVFNLLPIPPLDGSHLWPVLMPRSWRGAYERLLPWGTIFLLALLLWPGGSGFLESLTRTGALLVWNLVP